MKIYGVTSIITKNTVQRQLYWAVKNSKRRRVQAPGLGLSDESRYARKFIFLAMRLKAVHHLDWPLQCMANHFQHNQTGLGLVSYLIVWIWNRHGYKIIVKICTFWYFAVSNMQGSSKGNLMPRFSFNMSCTLTLESMRGIWMTGSKGVNLTHSLVYRYITTTVLYCSISTTVH